MIVDRDGVVLLASASRVEASELGAEAGADWSKVLGGATEARPSLLASNQPFESILGELSLVGAPLLGPRGPYGTLLLCARAPADPQRRALVQSAAAVIGENLTAHAVAQPADDPSEFSAEQLRGWLAEIVRQAPGGLAVADCRTGRIVLANRAAELAMKSNLLTVGVLSIGEKPLFDPRRADGSPLPPEEWPMVRALRGETVTGEEIELRRPDGTSFFASLSAGPVKDADGKTVALVITFQDITARRQAERERERLHEDERKAREEAERQAAMRERLMAILSHDLRQPLSLVKLNVDMLAPSVTGCEASLELVRRGVKQMESMIAGLLDYNRCVNGGMPISRCDADLRHIVAAALEQIHPSSRGRIELTFQGDCRGCWDADRLQQAFGNLLTNAVRHGDPTGHIFVQIRGLEDSVVLEVHNRGEPIPSAILQKPFAAFQRGPKGSGLGLGLYIVHEVVRAHGGSIAVESSSEAGTRFLITLPRAA
ncbi:MAG: ATP-binding protein [Myxococcales bacterium]